MYILYFLISTEKKIFIFLYLNVTQLCFSIIVRNWRLQEGYEKKCRHIFVFAFKRENPLPNSTARNRSQLRDLYTNMPNKVPSRANHSLLQPITTSEIWSCIKASLSDCNIIVTNEIRKKHFKIKTVTFKS